jgi:crotonobetainyl-CoA:carnitine CoA-transferase CaiB-like acyl-CoA transferase
MSVPLPLRNIRVVDISRVLAGPYCAQLLADQGAEVIKVESPGGDENRLWGARTPDGVTCNFHSVNRGKKGITLNLKSAEAHAILHKLVARADIVIQSFLPETAERLGISYEKMKAINPDIIFCSISGYGEKGELRDKPGYDLMMQAFSGIMSTTGVEGGTPIRSGVSFIDLSTGGFAYGAIMTALLNRFQGAGGCCVRVSLLETAVSILGYHAVAWLANGVLPRKEGSGVWHLVPYQAFECNDGYMLAGATNDVAWRRFCVALGHAELAHDERFAKNEGRLEHRPVLVSILEKIFATNSVAHWVERFDAEGVAAAPLNDLSQTLVHPQVLANDLVVEARTADGSMVKLVGAPFKLSTHRAADTPAAPKLGAHTDEILKQVLKYSDGDIARLRSSGAL